MKARKQIQISGIGTIISPPFWVNPDFRNITYTGGEKCLYNHTVPCNEGMVFDQSDRVVRISYDGEIQPLCERPNFDGVYGSGWATTNINAVIINHKDNFSLVSFDGTTKPLYSSSGRLRFSPLRACSKGPIFHFFSCPEKEKNDERWEFVFVSFEGESNTLYEGPRCFSNVVDQGLLICTESNPYQNSGSVLLIEPDGTQREIFKPPVGENWLAPSYGFSWSGIHAVYNNHYHLIPFDGRKPASYSGRYQSFGGCPKGLVVFLPNRLLVVPFEEDQPRPVWQFDSPGEALGSCNAGIFIQQEDDILLAPYDLSTPKTIVKGLPNKDAIHLDIRPTYKGLLIMHGVSSTMIEVK
ncbi:MAG: hypothetical protein WC805_00975 [Patescibacteria group bacterium]